MDLSSGELHLIDDDGAISGNYEPDSGDIGSIKSVRGLAEFEVFLSSSKKRQKYLVECIVHLEDEYFELEGDARLDPKVKTGGIEFYDFMRLQECRIRHVRI